MSLEADGCKNTVISTRGPGMAQPFLPEVRDVCHQFFAARVSAEHIPRLIRATLSLANKQIEILPSTLSPNDMAGEI